VDGDNDKETQETQETPRDSLFDEDDNDVVSIDARRRGLWMPVQVFVVELVYGKMSSTLGTYLMCRLQIQLKSNCSAQRTTTTMMMVALCANVCTCGCIYLSRLQE